MLPKPGIYYLPWELGAGRAPDGASVRTFGRAVGRPSEHRYAIPANEAGGSHMRSRLCLYDMAQSRATLRAQHGSDQHQVLVCTRLVEPFQAQVGSLYLVLGELEHQKDGGFVVKARVLTCVEGMNLPLLERAVQEQRLYLQERDGQ